MTLEEFYAIVDAIEPNEKGCKIWPRGTFGSKKPYAAVWINNKNYIGSRLSLERKLCRPIKKGYGALHICDVPRCVNSDHLWEGTNKENMDDRNKKGRQNRPIKDKNPFYGKFYDEASNTRSVIDLENGKVFGTIKECAEFYSLHRSGVTLVCQGKIKQTKGHRFAYLDSPNGQKAFLEETNQ